MVNLREREGTPPWKGGWVRMDIKKLEKRVCAMDLIRVTAVVCVIAVHFLLHTGFYAQPVYGKRMFVMCVMRAFLSCCVPLFLVLSGWLMCGKRLEKRYYLGLSGTLATYVLAGAACTVFNAVYLHRELSPAKVFFDFFDFTAADYSWYIEMYIGLFLLAPFLNLLYHALDTKGKKQALLLTMLLLTTLPTLTNSFNLEDPSWWASPAAVGGTTRLLPRWWQGCYPITYYLTGCYLREYGLRLKSRTIALLLGLATLAFGCFDHWQSFGTGFVTGPYVDWGGFQPYVLTVLLFVLLSRVDAARLPVPVRYGLWGVSELSLGIYLVSYIFDTIFYPRLNEAVPVMTDRLGWFPVMVGAVFVCSLLLSLILYWVREGLRRLFVRAARAAHMAARRDPARLERDRVRMRRAIFASCFGAAVVFALWKCPFGFGSYDDAFYLTVPHRLSMGDVLFADEWHVSQMAGLIGLPLVWLYRTVTGSMDGALLAARYAYVAFHALASLFFYSRVKEHGVPAMAAALSWFLFAPYDIMALSYNTMGMDFVLISGTLLATARGKGLLILSGVCLAAGVLCCPYLAAGYLLYAAGVGARALYGRLRPARAAGDGSVLVPSRLLWLTVGAAAAGAAFTAYVLSACGIQGLLDSLPYILSDPEHQGMSPLVKLKNTWYGLVHCHPSFKLVLGGYLVLLLAMLADRGRRERRAPYLIASCLLTLVSYAMLYPESAQVHYNAVMLPMFFVGLTCYLLCEEKPHGLFTTVFVGGIVYAVAVTLGSNNFFYAAAMASAVTNAASFLFLGRLLLEMKAWPDEGVHGVWLRRGAVGMAALTIAALLSIQVHVKAEHCFMDDAPAELTCRIEEGPARGIRTTGYRAGVYQRLNSELQYYENAPEGELLILNERSWCYLSTDPMGYATFSAWISGETQTALDRLEAYYELRPDKVPDHIFLSKDSRFDDPEAILAAAQAHGYVLRESDLSYYLEAPGLR